jgi:phosphoribosylformylglycinamidine synthase II
MNQALMVITTLQEPHCLLFWIRYSGTEISKSLLQTLAPLISDEVDQTLWINPGVNEWMDFCTPQAVNQVQIVHFKTGVTDNPAHAFQELLAFHPLFKNRELKVHSGVAALLSNKFKAMPANPLIQNSLQFLMEETAQLLTHKFSDLPKSAPKVETYALTGKNAAELAEMSKKQFWALSDAEMLAIQDHFKEKSPTDVEMEVLAQTWSEHCKHKIFGAHIDYEDQVSSKPENFKVQSLFKTYIEKPTFELQQKKDWAISVFKDNAGIVRFHDNVDLCIKVETHNSPSALDPYGGALTGILGVNRDIMGTGLGARPIANTNVLLFGLPDETHELPKGLLHPKEILIGVHRGIQDGGNKSGIPTINGAMLFDESFSGKPLVYCGTVGVLPREIQGVPSASKNQKPGDFIVMVGGAVGADGLHGATSSSLALDQTTPSGMVQIGDPLTQKRVLDFMLEARDQSLYSSLTDNGAGGLSSSIGEMAEGTGEPGSAHGARVYLDRVPLKYPGLLPWQILVSESQERMTLSVPKNKADHLIALATSRGVAATVVGEFTATGQLEIFYADQKVADLSLKFLHGGCPKMQLKAKWQGPQKRTSWKNSAVPREEIQDIQSCLEKLLSDPSLASKEKWIRQYDHEVQAATVVKPFEGNAHQEVNHSAPNDGGLVWMGAHGNEGYSGAAVASGICPDFSLLDGGLMAKLAADEAVRNLVVLGVDPNKVALIDNFCWPDPITNEKNPDPAHKIDAEHKLAQLVRTCRSLAELVRVYEMPLVSGKDSMKNDFVGKFENGKSVKISVLPTLLVTALGYHPDVRKAVKSHAATGSNLYLLGSADHSHYFGTTLEKYFGVETKTSLPEWNLTETRALYEQFFKATEKNLIASAHDLSEGGLLPALFETLLLNTGGIDLDLNALGTDAISVAFSEQPGRILVSVTSQNANAFETHFNGSYQKLGVVNASGEIKVKTKSFGSETLKLSELESIWKGVL